MVFIYAVLCGGLQLVFWLYAIIPCFLSELCGYLAHLIKRVPNIITEAVAISLLGSKCWHLREFGRHCQGQNAPLRLTVR